jgi:hypothetical protein
MAADRMQSDDGFFWLGGRTKIVTQGWKKILISNGSGIRAMSPPMRFSLPLLVSVLLGVGQVHASVVFTDSFEDPVVSGFSATTFSSGWTLNEPSSTDQLGLRSGFFQSGNQAAQINANGSPVGASFSRMIATNPGDQYMVSLWYYSFVGLDAAVRAELGSTLVTSPAAVLANTWYELTFLHTATSTSTLLNITDVTTDGASSDLFVDSITVSSVPEPTKLGFLGLSAFGMIFRRRRRQVV